MRFYITFFITIFCARFAFSQSPVNQRNQKGKIYAYWGWSNEWYTKSNITFTGKDYHFTLEKTVAKDRQSPFDFDTYFNPGNVTIPQYNFRLGYFISDKWNISIGIDHMKYVMQQNQTVKVTGEIANSYTPYNGVYNHTDIALTPDFLKFEHTDGLNYLNSEMRYFSSLATWNKVQIHYLAGAGIGALVPRTNTTLLNKERYDEFHLAGYGIGAVAGLNITFYKYFFIQTELKSGFINMPDIRTTKFIEDKAKQHFYFMQHNFVLGAIFPIYKK